VDEEEAMEGKRGGLMWPGRDRPRREDRDKEGCRAGDDGKV